MYTSGGRRLPGPGRAPRGFQEHGDHSEFNDAHESHHNRKIVEEKPFAHDIFLPDELVIAIFRRLDVPAILTAAGVCQEWRRFSTDPALWRGKWDRFLDHFEDKHDELVGRKRKGETIDEEKQELIQNLVRTCFRGANFHHRRTRADAINALAAILPEFYVELAPYSERMILLCAVALQEDGPLVSAAISFFAALAEQRADRRVSAAGGEGANRGPSGNDGVGEEGGGTRSLDAVLSDTLLPSLLGGLLGEVPLEGGDRGTSPTATVDCLSRLLRACRSHVLLPELESFVADNVNGVHAEAALLVFGAIAESAPLEDTPFNGKMLRTVVRSLRTPPKALRKLDTFNSINFRANMARVLEKVAGGLSTGEGGAPMHEGAAPAHRLPPPLERLVVRTTLRHMLDDDVRLVRHCCSIVAKMPSVFASSLARLAATQRRLIAVMARAVEQQEAAAALARDSSSSPKRSPSPGAAFSSPSSQRPTLPRGPGTAPPEDRDHSGGASCASAALHVVWWTAPYAVNVNGGNGDGGEEGEGEGEGEEEEELSVDWALDLDGDLDCDDDDDSEATSSTSDGGHGGEGSGRVLPSSSASADAYVDAEESVGTSPRDLAAFHDAVEAPDYRMDGDGGNQGGGHGSGNQGGDNGGDNQGGGNGGDNQGGGNGGAPRPRRRMTEQSIVREGVLELVDLLERCRPPPRTAFKFDPNTTCYCNDQVNQSGDLRAYMLEALGPALHICRYNFWHDDEGLPHIAAPLERMCEVMLAVLEEPLVFIPPSHRQAALAACQNNAYVEYPKQQAAGFLSFVVAETGPSFELWMDRVVPRLLELMGGCPYLLWDRLMLAVANLAYHCTTAFSRHYDRALDDVIGSTELMFNAGVYVGNALLCLGDMAWSVKRDICTGNRLERVFATLNMALGTLPQGDDGASNHVYCCTYHDPFYGYLEPYLVACQSLAECAQASPEFEPFLPHCIYAIGAAARVDVQQDPHLVQEALTNVALLSTLHRRAFMSLVTAEIRAMVKSACQAPEGQAPRVPQAVLAELHAAGFDAGLGQVAYFVFGLAQQAMRGWGDGQWYQ